MRITTTSNGRALSSLQLLYPDSPPLRMILIPCQKIAGVSSSTMRSPAPTGTASPTRDRIIMSRVVHVGIIPLGSSVAHSALLAEVMITPPVEDEPVVMSEVTQNDMGSSEQVILQRLSTARENSCEAEASSTKCRPCPGQCVDWPTYAKPAVVGTKYLYCSANPGSG